LSDAAIDAQALRDQALFLREETVRLIAIAKTGHFASSFSCAEILAVLYGDTLRLRRGEPDWPGRDRFLLGKGHAAVALYPLLAGLDFFPAEQLDTYTRLGSPFGDHPDMRRIPGVDFSSGSLGHGLSIGVGMAKAARLRGYDETRIWVLLGDQELNEGQVWEAAGSASHFDLGNLVAIVDANQMGLDGMTEETMPVEPIGGRFEAFGWDVVEIDGHDPEAILATAAELPPATSDKPRCIVARTVKGKGVSYMELSRTWHIGYLAPDDAAAALVEIDQRG